MHNTPLVSLHVRMCNGAVEIFNIMRYYTQLFAPSVESVVLYSGYRVES